MKTTPAAILVIAFLFAGIVQAQAPSILLQRPHPALVSGPIPHLSCPKGWWVNVNGTSPFCDIANSHHQAPRGIDPDKQEIIYWQWTKTIPAGGILKVDWLLPFTTLPGCSIAGDEVKHVELVEEKKDHLTIHGTAGTVLVFTCNGVLSR